jgi:protein phosphatase PTC1
VDLIRHTQDPQVASKQLVDHALARFSTDNLSCMVIRFDTRALQSHAAHKAPPIGVEGDAPFKKRGGISEVDALVKEARKSIKKDKDGPAMETVSTKESQESKESRESKEKLTEEIIKEEEEEEPGPELTPEGAKDVPPSATAAKAAVEMATKKK